MDQPKGPTDRFEEGSADRLEGSKDRLELEGPTDRLEESTDRQEVGSTELSAAPRILPRRLTRVCWRTTQREPDGAEPIRRRGSGSSLRTPR